MLEKNSDEYNSARDNYEKKLKEIEVENPDLKFGLYQNISYDVNGTEQSYLMCNSGALDIFRIPDMKLLKTLKEYHGQKEVPVLISYDLADKYKEGNVYSFPCDVLEEFQPYQIKIAGILPQDTRVCQGGSSTLGDSIEVAENIILGPEICSFELEAYRTNLICLAPEGFDVETEFIKRQWDVNIRTIDDDVAEYFEQEKFVMFGAIGLSLILLILSVIGCVGTLLSMIFSRTEEFGIYFALGMQKRNLRLLVLGEVGSIFFLSYLFASAVFAVILLCGMAAEAAFFPAATLAVTFAVISFCAFLCVILPVRRLMKWNPVDLLNNRKE